MVYGTEMGSTKVEAKNIVEAWEKESVAVELLEGDDAGDVFDSITAEKYRLVVVLTSSYGDGDPPSGYGKFLYKLYTAVQAGSTPMKGLEHAVLGFGSTTYYTFQNMPRLTDRLLEELGSRRFLKRVEIDEMEDLKENETKVGEWRSAVGAHYAKEAKASEEPSVCAWTEPESEVYEKRLGPDGFELGPEPSNMVVPVICAALAVAAGAYYRYYYI